VKGGDWFLVDRGGKLAFVAASVVGRGRAVGDAPRAAVTKADDAAKAADGAKDPDCPPWRCR